MKTTPKSPKSPIAEGVGYGVVSWLSIDHLSPNYLLIVSWSCFLIYLLARYYVDNHLEKMPVFAPVVHFSRIIGWALIVPLAILSCIGAAQQ